MANVRSEYFGELSGRDATLYTLRNSKGNELKITDYGARMVSMRFRDKYYNNKLMLQTYPDVSGYVADTSKGIVLIDDTHDFDKILWKVEHISEGLKFTAHVAERHVEIIYSLSNDNEISIKYSARGVKEISTQLIFDAEVLTDADIRVYDEAKTQGKISGSNVYAIVDEPAVVEMEVGMFGYDPGCPIDWNDAGLKNAADIVSEVAGISVNVFVTQSNLHVDEVEGGFAIKTSDPAHQDGEIKAQTVYVFKNRD